MTPHLVRFKNGDEFDVLTRRGRRVHRFRPDAPAAVKRKFRRRERRAFKAWAADCCPVCCPAISGKTNS